MSLLVLHCPLLHPFDCPVAAQLPVLMPKLKCTTIMPIGREGGGEVGVDAQVTMHHHCASRRGKGVWDGG